MRGAQVASDLLDQAFADFVGINRTDARCIDIVEQHGRVTAGDLAKEAGLTTGAVTALVDRLEEAGLLQRAYDRSDRRKVFIELTPAAQGLSEEVYGPMGRARTTYLQGLSDDQLVTIISFLEVTRRVSIELAEAVRNRTTSKVAPLRFRIEQAKMLKADAKTLLKTVKNELKDLARVGIDISVTQWVKDETGRWVKKTD